MRVDPHGRLHGTGIVNLNKYVQTQPVCVISKSLKSNHGGETFSKKEHFQMVLQGHQVAVLTWSLLRYQVGLCVHFEVGGRVGD